MRYPPIPRTAQRARSNPYAPTDNYDAPESTPHFSFNFSRATQLLEMALAMANPKQKPVQSSVYKFLTDHATYGEARAISGAYIGGTLRTSALDVTPYQNHPNLDYVEGVADLVASHKLAAAVVAVQEGLPPPPVLPLPGLYHAVPPSQVAVPPPQVAAPPQAPAPIARPPETPRGARGKPISAPVGDDPPAPARYLELMARHGPQPSTPREVPRPAVGAYTLEDLIAAVTPRDAADYARLSRDRTAKEAFITRHPVYAILWQSPELRRRVANWYAYYGPTLGIPEDIADLLAELADHANRKAAETGGATPDPETLRRERAETARLKAEYARIKQAEQEAAAQEQARRAELAPGTGTALRDLLSFVGQLSSAARLTEAERAALAAEEHQRALARLADSTGDGVLARIYGGMEERARRSEVATQLNALLAKHGHTPGSTQVLPADLVRRYAAQLGLHEPSIAEATERYKQKHGLSTPAAPAPPAPRAPRAPAPPPPPPAPAPAASSAGIDFMWGSPGSWEYLHRVFVAHVLHAMYKGPQPANTQKLTAIFDQAANTHFGGRKPTPAENQLVSKQLKDLGILNIPTGSLPKFPPRDNRSRR